MPGETTRAVEVGYHPLTGNVGIRVGQSRLGCYHVFARRDRGLDSPPEVGGSS